MAALLAVEATPHAVSQQLEGRGAELAPQRASAPATTLDDVGLRLRHQIEEQEYHASRNQHGLQAPNRTHNLRAYFEPEGLRLTDRTASGEPELMALRLASLGRAGSERVVPPGEVSSAGPRVQIRRPGLTEWYVNGSAGVEQGFTLEERPAGDGRLALKLALSSGSARSAGAGAALLRAASGRELRYAGLVVLDAQGRSVHAELRVTEPHELRIEVDDAGAVYPLTVDPLVTAVADAVLQSNQADARLGASVAGAGDVNGDGYADVIVGAPYYDAGEGNEGAAFVFLGGPSGIANGNPTTAGALLQANQANANMGDSVAGAGDVNGDGFDDVIVGAPYYTQTVTNEGAAFVFLGGPTGIADGNPTTASATLRSFQADAHLGVKVAGAGDVNGDDYADVIVGAPNYTASDEGLALVFLGGPSGVANGNPLTASTRLFSNQAGAGLGRSVAGAGDVNGDGYADVIVGAEGYDAGELDEGAAFVFLGGSAGIPDGTPTTASATLQANQVNAWMGYSVAGAGDVNGDGYADVIVGAIFYFSGGGGGAAFVFLGAPTGIASGNPTTASATLLANQAGANMGLSVAGAGDTDDDGYADVIVGANNYDAGQADEGAAFVFLGGPTGIPSGNPATASATLQANQTGAHLGRGVAGAGDVNGDGFADVIVGAGDYYAGETQEGAAFVFLGGFVKGDLNGDLKTDLVLRYQPTGANLAWLMNGTTRVSQTAITPDPVGLDWRIAGIDDFNGDWRNDLVFWNQATGGTTFWLMNGTVLTGVPGTLASPLAPPWKLSATADFNHDGKPDLLWRNSSTQKIVVWTMNGTAQVGQLIPSPDQAVNANWEIVAALDWNGDHFTDLLWYNASSGKIVLWFMDASLVRITGQFTNPPNAGNNNWNVVAAGDYGWGPSGLAGTKDIVWRNATSGNIVAWHMDQAANRTAGVFTTPTAPSPNPTDWTIVGPR